MGVGYGDRRSRSCLTKHCEIFAFNESVMESNEGIVVVVNAFKVLHSIEEALQHFGLGFRIYDNKMSALLLADLSCLVPRFRSCVELVVTHTGEQFVSWCGVAWRSSRRRS
jgi:hypothetical protein